VVEEICRSLGFNGRLRYPGIDGGSRLSRRISIGAEKEVALSEKTTFSFVGSTHKYSLCVVLANPKQLVVFMRVNINSMKSSKWSGGSSSKNGLSTSSSAGSSESPSGSPSESSSAGSSTSLSGGPSVSPSAAMSALILISDMIAIKYNSGSKRVVCLRCRDIGHDMILCKYEYSKEDLKVTFVFLNYSILLMISFL